VANPILLFPRRFFYFRRGDLNLMLKKPFDSFLLEEGKTGRPHDSLY
jgi:hypothetical protein